MIPLEYLLLGVAVMLLLSVVSSKASTQLGVPTLVLFLLIGMLAGSDGPGGIEFNNPWLAQYLGTVALIFILFSGGLDTKWKEIKPVLLRGEIASPSSPADLPSTSSALWWRKKKLRAMIISLSSTSSNRMNRLFGSRRSLQEGEGIRPGTGPAR